MLWENRDFLPFSFLCQGICFRIMLSILLEKELFLEHAHEVRTEIPILWKHFPNDPLTYLFQQHLLFQ